VGGRGLSKRLSALSGSLQFVFALTNDALLQPRTALLFLRGLGALAAPVQRLLGVLE
jgi:hypothetical protein